MTSLITPEARVAAAQVAATAARAQLGATVDELKYRVSPQTLAQDAADTMKDKGLALVEVARRKPATTAAVVTGIVLFFARNRIARLLRRGADAPETSPSKSKSKKGSAA